MSDSAELARMRAEIARTEAQEEKTHHVYVHALNLEMYEEKRIEADDSSIAMGYVADTTHPLRKRLDNTGVFWGEDIMSKERVIIKTSAMEKLKEVCDLPDGVNSVEEYLLQQDFPKESPVVLPIQIDETDGILTRVYESGTVDLEQYLITDRNTCSPRDATSIAIQVAKGLQDLHDRGVVHADLDASNVVLNTDGSVGVIDVEEGSIEENGICQRSMVRGVNEVLGGNRYICPPELLTVQKGEDTVLFDHTVDIYQTGALLYKMMTGYPAYVLKEYEGRGNRVVGPDDDGYRAFAKERMLAYKQLHAQGNIEFPDEIPDVLRKVIAKAMNPDPKKRYASAADFGDALIKVYDALPDMQRFDTDTKREAPLPSSLESFIESMPHRLSLDGYLDTQTRTEETPIEKLDYFRELPPGIRTVEDYLIDQGISEQTRMLLPTEITEQDNTLIRMYEYEGIDLETYLQDGNKISQRRAIRVMVETCAALEALHHYGVAHTDIRAGQILLQPDGDVRLAGIEQGNIEKTDQTHERHGVRGNRFALPPELLGETHPGKVLFDKTVDTYEVGATLYTILTGSPPHVQEDMEGPHSLSPDDPNFEAFHFRRMAAYKKAREEKRLTFPNRVPKQLQDVIRKAMHRDPDERYESAEALGRALIKVHDTLPA